MVSVASTSATMDLTAVLPALMEGIAQEVGVDMNEFKVVLVGEETQLDAKSFQILKEHYHQVEWEHKKLPPVFYPASPSMQPHVEIRRENDTPFFQPNETNWRSIPSDACPTRIWTDGDKPVDLYQRGTFGSCLCSIRARALWPTQGNFIAKGAPRYYQSSLFNGGTHQSIDYPELWAQSPLPIETFLHVCTWRTRYPQFHWENSLEFNVTYVCVKGLTRCLIIHGVLRLNGPQIMRNLIFLTCVACETASPDLYGLWTMIGDICPSHALQLMYMFSFHPVNRVLNQLPNHHA